MQQALGGNPHSNRKLSLRNSFLSDNKGERYNGSLIFIGNQSYYTIVLYIAYRCVSSETQNLARKSLGFQGHDSYALATGQALNQWRRQAWGPGKTWPSCLAIYKLTHCNSYFLEVWLVSQVGELSLFLVYGQKIHQGRIVRESGSSSVLLLYRLRQTELYIKMRR